MVKRTPNRLSRTQKVDTCKRITSLISDYPTGELDPETAISFEDHLSKCSDCVAFRIHIRKPFKLLDRTFERKANLQEATPESSAFPEKRSLLERGCFFCVLCDEPFFKNQDIAVVGGGSSAVE